MSTEKKVQKAQDKSGKQDFVFDKRNYIIMVVGLVVMMLGFILMIGGGSEDPNVFNPEIFNTQRLTIAPILVIGGFVIEVFAIMLTPAEKTEE